MTLRNRHFRNHRLVHPILCTLTIASGPICCGNQIDPRNLPHSHCDSDATRIHDVQGPFDSSPLVGQVVTIEGVVVGDFQGSAGLDGFFVQEQDSQVDNDPSTSEGLFVYSAGQSTMVQKGDVVRVTGTVSEYHGLTELGDVSEVRMCERGASVTPTSLSLPIASPEELEAFEGMSVHFPQRLFVTDTHDLRRYGRVTLSSGGRLVQPTNIVAPGVQAQALQSSNDCSKIELDDGSSVENPKVPPYAVPQGSLRLGNSIQDLFGVLTESSGTYQIQPVAPPDTLRFDRNNPRPAVPPDPGGSLKIASFNLDNYFATIDSGSPVCGPLGGLDCRGADTPSEFTRQRAKILSALSLISADVVGLIEIENNASESLADLVNGLNGQLGIGTYAFIDTGAIGTDAIKVGLIYKPSSVTPNGKFALLDSSIDPSFNDNLNRPVLAQTFEQRSNGERFTLAVNHWKSKGSKCPNDTDTHDGQGNCNLTRTAAARAELAWLATDPTGTGDADVLMIGDLNSYAMEDPISAITSGGYVNLVARFLGSNAYSYAFGGQSGTLDHALSSPSLVSQVAGVTEWHINADEPAIFDYNQEGNPPALYSPDPYRASDHDPLIVGLQLGGPD